MNPKKILVAVDASANALRAIDYVGEVVAGRPGFKVRLLCIEQLPHRDLFENEESWVQACRNGRAEFEDFLEQGRERLLAMGMSEEEVEKNYVAFCHSPFNDQTSRCSMGTSVALEILETVKSGGFGTVVVGRRGLSKAEEFLFGSVSNKIVHSARDCTVWVVS